MLKSLTKNHCGKYFSTKIVKVDLKVRIKNKILFLLKPVENIHRLIIKVCY